MIVSKYLSKYIYSKNTDLYCINDKNDLYKSNFSIINKESQIDLKNIKKKNYLGAWKSVNDVQVQLGNKFIKFINDIEKLLSKNRTVKVYYETKIWVLKNVKS